jgi:hypothetical protein
MIVLYTMRPEGAEQNSEITETIQDCETSNGGVTRRTFFRLAFASGILGLILSCVLERYSGKKGEEGGPCIETPTTTPTPTEAPTTTPTGQNISDPTQQYMNPGMDRRGFISSLVSLALKRR